MAISTMDSAKSSNKKDDAIPPSKYRGPEHTLINAMHDKVDVMIAKINSIDAAITVGSSTTIAFGDMITVPAKGKTPASYSIVMTVTNGGVSKSTTLTLT
tara:strand:+ start:1223 stop:1522 length:300 start_codon:yes stop_codon:yes gene_type:complete